MFQRLCFGCGVLALVLLPGLVRGQTVYSDGGDHTVTGASGPISIQNSGTTLTVDSPAVVTGSAAQFGNAIVGESGTAINLLGGSVTGSLIGSPFGDGIGIDTAGAFAAFGGSVSGVELGVRIRGSAPALIAGGSFQGGSSIGGGGFAFNSQSTALYSSNVSILGGGFYGGVAEHSGAGGTAISLNGNFNISGGTFVGGAGTGTGIGGQAAYLNIGQFGTAQTGSISGGTFVVGASGSEFAQSTLNIAENNGSVINISGGSISGILEENIQDKYSTLNFFGSNLIWTETSSTFFRGSYETYGSLSGTLSDGSALNIGLEVYTGIPLGVLLTGDPLDEELTFEAVEPNGLPEPSSVVTLAIGAVGVATACASGRARQRRRRFAIRATQVVS